MMLHNEDCLSVMRSMADETVQMAYLDPPFFTQKDQVLHTACGEMLCFSDTWASKDAYLLYMKARLEEVRRVLKKNGTIFLHCDSKASHCLRTILDSVFGEDNFQSEIIWSYKRWSNARKGLLPGHQTIFFYSKTPEFTFHVLYGNYSPTTNVDQILQARERNRNGKAVYKRDGQGHIISAGEKKGVPLSDVWEIPFLNPKARERIGYPTQKPMELLERIIKISTDEGDMILDPFCGSGTTLAAASLLNRQCIGIDSNPDAIRITRQRLFAPYKTESKVIKIGEDAYKTKTEDELSILRQLDCVIVQRNKGMDALLKKHYSGGPVAIKIQKESETVSESLQALYRAGEKKRCSYTVLIARDPVENAILPSNMVILYRYDSQLEQELGKKLLKRAE